jgi:hypothetical protein
MTPHGVGADFLNPCANVARNEHQTDESSTRRGHVAKLLPSLAPARHVQGKRGPVRRSCCQVGAKQGANCCQVRQNAISASAVCLVGASQGTNLATAAPAMRLRRPFDGPLSPSARQRAGLKTPQGRPTRSLEGRPSPEQRAKTHQNTAQPLPPACFRWRSCNAMPCLFGVCVTWGLKKREGFKEAKNASGNRPGFTSGKERRPPGRSPTREQSGEAAKGGDLRAGWGVVE